MSVDEIDVLAIILPNPQYSARGRPSVIQNYGYYQDIPGRGDNIRTLSSRNPNGYDLSQGVLYVPTLDESDPCTAELAQIYPSNVTRMDDFYPNQNYPFVAIFPWTSPTCVQSNFAQMRVDGVRAALTYLPDNSTASPPWEGDRAWWLFDQGDWRQQNPYPVLAIPGATGTDLLRMLSLYSGNMSDAPFGQRLTELYDDRDYARLYARIDFNGRGNRVPTLWIFLIIVLAVLLAVILCVSIIMTIVQKRQRRNLQRRIANGEVDLEVLGIKQMNVPQEAIDKMPKYVYTARTDGPRSNVKGAPRESAFTQPVCAICLDDFVTGETDVRELPCEHIFHPECIDPFLKTISSLCPLCKKTALPVGYCPVTVTNLMVRRERLSRRAQRQTLRDQQIEAGTLPMHHRMSRSVVGVGRQVGRRVNAIWWPSEPAPVGRGGRPDRRARLVDLRDQQATQGQELTTVPPTSATQSSNTEQDQINTSTPPTTSAPIANVAAEPIPTEIAAQGSEARRNWRRQRVASMYQHQFNAEAAATEQIDVRRPLWRRVAGRVHPRFE